MGRKDCGYGIRENGNALAVINAAFGPLNFFGDYK
jgi:hypothetical protein